MNEQPYSWTQDKRIAAGIGVVALLLCGIAIYNIVQAKKSTAITEQASDEKLESGKVMIKFNDSVLKDSAQATQDNVKAIVEAAGYKFVPQNYRNNASNGFRVHTQTQSLTELQAKLETLKKNPLIKSVQLTSANEFIIITNQQMTSSALEPLLSQSSITPTDITYSSPESNNTNSTSSSGNSGGTSVSSSNPPSVTSNETSPAESSTSPSSADSSNNGGQPAAIIIVIDVPPGQEEEAGQSLQEDNPTISSYERVILSNDSPLY